jgi:predicted nucleic acid-binding protein
MWLVDTSVWVIIFRDKTGQARTAFEAVVGENAVCLSRFSQMELLQGCRDEAEWNRLNTYLEDQDYAEITAHTWIGSARLYFELRRQGLTVRSAIDCCIAQLALDYQLTLLHCDLDFDVIQQIRPIQTAYFPQLSA